jgi:hypothetical protein
MRLGTDEVAFDDATDLGGFSLREFMSFWSELAEWSELAVGAYFDATDSGVPQERALPTQLIRRDDFLRSMQVLTGLSGATTHRVAERLTYDLQAPKRDPFLQPLMACNEAVLWSPHAVSLSNQPRNILKLLARTPDTSNLAATAIGQRERVFVAQLGRQLSSKRAHWQWKLSVRPHESTDGEVDLLAWTPRAPDQLLVIEAKTVLEADEVGEMQNVSAQFTHGQEQLRRSIGLLQESSLVHRRAQAQFVPWERVNKYYGVVISPETEPTSEFDHVDVPAISFRSMALFVPDRSWRSPEALHAAVAGRRWEGMYHLDNHIDLEMDGITFRLPRADPA